MKSEDRWAPVSTVSGKVDHGSGSVSQGGERVALAQPPCAPSEAIWYALEAHEAQFHAGNVTLVPRIPPGLPCVNLEVGEVEYAVSSLAQDAVGAMAGGGVLWVIAYEETVGRAPIVPGRYVVLAIKDTGRRRAPELGSIQEVVARRGGGIIWQAAPGAGTRVNVYLPVA